MPTRYPNGLAGGVPFEAFGEWRALRSPPPKRFVEAARTQLQPG